MAYADRRERNKGVRYRGMYKAAHGSYRSAGTFSTEERALEVAREAERHALIAGPVAGAVDPTTRATRTVEEYAPLFCGTTGSRGKHKERYADTLGLHGSRSSVAADWPRPTGQWRASGPVTIGSAPDVAAVADEISALRGR